MRRSRSPTETIGLLLSILLVVMSPLGVMACQPIDLNRMYAEQEYDFLDNVVESVLLPAYEQPPDQPPTPEQLANIRAAITGHRAAIDAIAARHR